MDPEVPHIREVLDFALATALAVVLCVVVAVRLIGPINGSLSSDEGVIVRTAT
jgi:hypothetical protein